MALSAFCVWFFHSPIYLGVLVLLWFYRKNIIKIDVVTSNNIDLRLEKLQKDFDLILNRCYFKERREP